MAACLGKVAASKRPFCSKAARRVKGGNAGQAKESRRIFEILFPVRYKVPAQNKCLASMVDGSEIRSIILTVQIASLRLRVSDSLIANRWVWYTSRLASGLGPCDVSRDVLVL